MLAQIPIEQSSLSLEDVRGPLRGCRRLRSLCMQADTRILPEQEPEVKLLSLARLDISGFCMEDKTAVDRYLGILALKLTWLKMERRQFRISQCYLHDRIAPPCDGRGYIYSDHDHHDKPCGDQETTHNCHVSYFCSSFESSPLD